MKLLIRDDGAVFNHDSVLEAEKNMRLASANEVARYKECLENKEKFVPDRPGAVSFQQNKSNWALDLSNGELVERQPGLCASGGCLVLSEEQVQFVRNYINGKDLALSEEGALDESKDLESMTVMELRKYAKDKFEIDIDKSTRKAEAIALIRGVEKGLVG